MNKVLGAVVAIVGLVALLDVAVETFWSGSPIRWSIVLPAVTFVALIVLLWRPGGSPAGRSGWGGAAITSILGLLVLLVVSAWLPGGQTNGVRMLLQPTTTVLTAATLLAVALAAVILVRALTVLPSTFRLVAIAVVAALAVYALAALGLALWGSTPFAAIMQGGAAWPRFPRWLQGTFVGAFLLVPLAILAQIVRFVDRLRRKKPLRSLAVQTAGLGMAFLVGLSGLTAPPRPTGSVSVRDDVSPSKPPTPEERAQLATQMDQLFDQLAASDRELPHESFDPAAVVAQIGKEPEKLFEYVRDHTYWVPYQGALRGAAGVLSDRLGSSLDRALLLAELLRSAGHTVRLAHAVVDEAEARQLAQAMRPAPSDVIGAVIGRNQQIEQAIAALATRIEGAIGVEVQPPVADHAVADAADRWWVQVEDPHGWIDADPATPGAKYSQPPTTPAAETFAWDTGDHTLPVPASVIHQVVVRVVIEKWVQDQLVEKPVLEMLVQPAALRESSVVLRHLPLRGSHETDSAGDPGNRSAQLAQDEWVPVLVVNGRAFVQRGFNAAGNEIDKPQLGRGGASGPSSSGMVGGVGGGLGGGESDEEARRGESALTAEWLEYEIRAPGRTPRVIRREVFDMIGPAARAAGIPSMPQYTDDQRIDRVLALSGGIESLMISSRPTQEWFFHLLYQDALAQRTKWRAIVAEPDAEKRQALIATLSEPTAMYVYAAARHAFSPDRGAAYIDSVNIVNQRILATLDDKKQVRTGWAIDVVANDVAARGSAAEVAKIRLRQGLADTAAERLSLDPSGSGMVNTYVLFASAPPAGAHLIALRDPKDPRVQNLPFAADVRARIAADVALGYAVVMYDRPWTVEGTARTGWWRVHPMTGETVGVTEDGYHSAKSEYVEVTEVTAIDEMPLQAPVGKWFAYRSKLGVLKFFSQHAIDICEQMGWEVNANNIITIRAWKTMIATILMNENVHLPM